MSELHTPRANLRIQLAPGLSPDLAELCRVELAHFADCLAPWGRFTQPVLIADAASMTALVQATSAPVDGILCAVAETRRITLLRPEAWTATPSRLKLRRTLTHELAHCLLFQRCAPASRGSPVALPTWFREGMAIVASEGAPTSDTRRHLDDDHDLNRLAHADASVVGQDAYACYSLAHLLFFRWHDTFGSRRFSSLCRHMRAGHPFTAAFAIACEQPAASWISTAIAALQVVLTDRV